MIEQEAAINLMYLLDLSEDPANSVGYFNELNQYLSDQGCTFRILRRNFANFR